MILSLLSQLALAGPCAVPTTPDQLRTTTDDAMLAFVTLDDQGFSAAADRAEDQLRCLDEVIPPRLAAAYHRVSALEAMMAGDTAKTESALRGSLLVEPDYVLSSRIAPEGGRLYRTYEAARSAGTPTTEDLGLPHAFVNGTAADRAPTVPAVLQVVDDAGAIRWSGVITGKVPAPLQPIDDTPGHDGIAAVDEGSSSGVDSSFELDPSDIDPAKFDEAADPEGLSEGVGGSDFDTTLDEAAAADDLAAPSDLDSGSDFDDLAVRSDLDSSANLDDGADFDDDLGGDADFDDDLGSVDFDDDSGADFDDLDSSTDLDDDLDSGEDFDDLDRGADLDDLDSTEAFDDDLDSGEPLASGAAFDDGSQLGDLAPTPPEEDDLAGIEIVDIDDPVESTGRQSRGRKSPVGWWVGAAVTGVAAGGLIGASHLYYKPRFIETPSQQGFQQTNGTWYAGAGLGVVSAGLTTIAIAGSF